MSMFEGEDNPLSKMRENPEDAPPIDPNVAFTANMARYAKSVMDDYKQKGALVGVCGEEFGGVWLKCDG